MSPVGAMPVDALAGGVQRDSNTTSTSSISNIVQASFRAGHKQTKNALQQQKNRAVRWSRIEKLADEMVPTNDRTAVTSLSQCNAGKEICAWGDDMLIESQHCRILYNNCRGIPQESNFAKCHELGDTVNEMNVDILGLAETNLDWSNQETANTCDAIFRKHWGPNKANKSSSDVTFKSPYQPTSP
jgi:hypothetical protein